MEKKLNILYVSTFCSERLISEMLKSNHGTPNLAAQKYHRLLAQGMVLNEDLFNLNVLSIPDYNSGTNNKKIIFTNSEIEKGVKYSYAPIVLIPIIKRLIIAFYLFAKIIKWRLNSKYKHNLLLFDILNMTTSLVVIFTSKIFRIKSIAIVTDLPEMMYVLKNKISIIDRLSYSIQNLMLSVTNGYVVLTEALNTAINNKRKPFCMIEGLADIQLLSNSNKPVIDFPVKLIHYSGGLYEKFGVKALIDAFMLIKRNDIRLHLFGNGDLIGYINKCLKIDSRIVFFGYQDNKAVLEDQLKSFVLVNPRFSDEEYAKYSFPSKTIEYMASGIPLLTTKLLGIPAEYSNFVYLFEEENVEGYNNSLQQVLNKTRNEILVFGEQAKKFVLMKKNNKIQAKIFYNHFMNKI